CSVAEGLELEPHGRLDDPFAAGEGPKTAVRAGNDPLAIPDNSYGVQEPARNHFRMLDDIRGRVDDAWQKHHVVRKRILPQSLIFMLVPRIGELDTQPAGVRLIQDRQDPLKRNVVNVRPILVTPAAMQTHALTRDTFNSVVKCRDMHFSRSHKL